MDNLRLYHAVLGCVRKAVSKEAALNQKDTSIIRDSDPDPEIMGSLILKMRKRVTLSPADITELRVAVREAGSGCRQFGKDFEIAINETWLEHEARKETPQARG